MDDQKRQFDAYVEDIEHQEYIQYIKIQSSMDQMMEEAVGL